MYWTKTTSLSEGFALGQACDLHCLSKVIWMHFVDGQLQNSRQKSKKNSPEIVRPKRDGSLTCVSRFSPCGVNGKEACHTTQELVQDENMDRQRAFVENMDRQRAFVPSH
jgi:hypothetical protein